MQQEPWVVMRVITASLMLQNVLRIRLGKDQFQLENMGLNLDNVLQRNQIPYQGWNPTEAAKAQ